MLFRVFMLFILAFGGNVRLYLKDGTYQWVSEYKVVKDRVSYLSAEREEWDAQMESARGRNAKMQWSPRRLARRLKFAAKAFLES